MKLIHLGAISTGVIIVLGILMIAPAFTQLKPEIPKNAVMLSFSILDDSNTPLWCNDLSSTLQKHNIKATIFVTGKIADQHPECVTIFVNNEKVDVGSQTYSYIDLPSISDYSQQLEEVRNGKEAVDKAGEINSRLFKAPYGSTDDNIYSLLSRSDIIADFSYDKQYNKYHEGQFIWFSLATYQAPEYSPNLLNSLASSDIPTMINFDNHTPIEQIDIFILKLKSASIPLVNASELTALDLTVQEGD
jgi:peptidoglycan/xylan/chitin deacetylase (PgdA/CDA1 family)